MNSKLLLIKCITLMYCESQVEDKRDKSKDLVLQAVTTVKMPELNVTISPEYEVIDGLRRTVIEMAHDPIDMTYDRVDLIQRVRMICLDEPSVYESFKDTIDHERDQIALKKMCVNIRRTLNSHFRDEKIKEIFNKAQAKLRFEGDKIVDFGQFAEDVSVELEAFRGIKDDKDPAVVVELSTSNREGFIKVFNSVKEQESGASVFKCGWQGVNRMLNHQIRRGANIVIGALQHNFKTGFTFNFFRQMLMYTPPVLIDPTKKPCAVWITFEDEAENNLRFMYVSIRCNEVRGTIPKDEIDNKTAEEMTDYIIEHMSRTGYEFKLLQVNPSDWTYKKIHNKIQEYEADGFEVMVLGCDYLSLVPTAGCSEGPAGHALRDLFRRMRNFTNARKITFITPHQLSTDAKQLIRDGKQAADFVKDIAGKGYYAGSKQIDQEVDIELYIHIVHFNGRAYLTVQRGKHRGLVGQTPLEHLYTILPFMDGTKGYNCGILDDINHEDSSSRKIGASGANDEAWWDTAA